MVSIHVMKTVSSVLDFIAFTVELSLVSLERSGINMGMLQCLGGID
jgi:hypothetical protein